MALISTLHTLSISFRYRFYGKLLTLFLRMSGSKVGKGLKSATIPVFKISPRANYRFGNYVTIGRGVTFEIGEKGSLILEDKVIIGDQVLISSMGDISMGKYSGLAEMVVMRGSFHETAAGTPYVLQGNFTQPISIGEDCLIGSGAVILWGTSMPDGCIIGAHSIVNSKSQMQENGIYAGNSLRFIRMRDERK